MIYSQLFCTEQVFVQALEARGAHSMPVLSKQPSQYQLQQLWKCVVVAFAHKSELMFDAKNNFVIIVKISKDVFQRHTKWKSSVRVWILCYITLSNCKTIVEIISSNWRDASVPESLYHNWFKPLLFWKSSRYFNSPSIVVAWPGWNRLSTSCPESWYFIMLKRCIIASFVRMTTSSFAYWVSSFFISLP